MGEAEMTAAECSGGCQGRSIGRGGSHKSNFHSPVSSEHTVTCRGSTDPGRVFHSIKEA